MGPPPRSLGKAGGPCWGPGKEGQRQRPLAGSPQVCTPEMQFGIVGKLTERIKASPHSGSRVCSLSHVGLVSAPEEPLPRLSSHSGLDFPFLSFSVPRVTASFFRSLILNSWVAPGPVCFAATRVIVLVGPTLWEPLVSALGWSGWVRGQGFPGGGALPTGLAGPVCQALGTLPGSGNSGKLSSQGAPAPLLADVALRSWTLQSRPFSCFLTRRP